MKVTSVAQKPTEGKWFKVDPETIDPNLFKKEKKDQRQEWARQIILEAFTEVKNNPGKYPGKFKTMMPPKTWSQKSVTELKQYASDLGDHIANWVEQALEWAQRIHNGETWEAVCNEPDTASWYRLIIWKNGYSRLAGGYCKSHDHNPAAYVYHHDYHALTKLHTVVPLVVLYE